MIIELLVSIFLIVKKIRKNQKIFGIVLKLIIKNMKMINYSI